MAPAKAISNWMANKNPAQIELHDGFMGASNLIKGAIENGYRFSQTKGKWMFELMYAIHKFKPFALLSSWIVSIFVFKALKRKIFSLKPSKIVIYHFFLIRPTLRIVKKYNLNIPVITVVTDPFTAHPIWFLQPNQHFIVFSNKLKASIERKHRINPKNVSVFPFTLNPKYNNKLHVQREIAFKAYLGIDLNRKVVLLIGGADGLPRGDKVLLELCKVNLNADIIVVCGTNKSLRNKANNLKCRFKEISIHVLGYTNYVHELVSISDAVITKCGASTFMEILLCGKIPLVNTFIWEQEKGNVDFLREYGMGVFEPNPKKLAQFTELVLYNKEFNKKLRENISQMRLENGTPYVSDFISNFKNSNDEFACNIRLAY